MNIVYIPIEEILEDWFFCFTSKRDFPGLRRSIEISGIRTPLHVRRADKGFQLLSGFHRYRLACSLDLKSVPAVLVEDERDMGRIFHEILFEQASCRSFTLVEKARILSILDELAVPVEEIQRNFLPLLEIPGQGRVISEIKHILDYSETLQNYIEKYNLSLKQAVIFNALEPLAQEQMALLGFHLQIRSVELLDITQHLLDIARREGSPMHAVFEDLKIISILQDEDVSRNRKLETIKSILKERKYPRLNAWNRQLSGFRSQLNLPENVLLNWDPTLEGPGLRFQGTIRSREDVEKVVLFFSDEGNRKTLNSMMKIV
jgi:hypothetical protein